MKNVLMLLILSVAMASLVLPVWSADDETIDGSISVGARFADTEDSPDKAAEFETTEEDGSATINMDLITGNENRYISIDGQIYNEDDLYAVMEMKAHPMVENTFSFKRYLHRLGHDYMESLTARESVDPEENTPGGKMVTHEDTDPDAHYGFVVTELNNNFAIKMGEHTKLNWKFRQMSRKGHKQTRSVNHCSMCHVVGRTTRVDEEVRDNSLGLTISTKKLNLMYEFMISEFQNFVDAPRNYYDNAEHPVSGEKDAEFEPRTIFEDEELAYARTPDTKKTSHVLKFSGDFNDTNRLVGKISLINLKNKLENLEMDTQYGAIRWLYQPDKKWTFRATVSRESIDNDDVYLDFLSWREGREGGGQSFDFTRYSAYNRDLTVAQLHSDFEISRCSTLQFDYRFRSIDREYLEIAQDSNETETVENRFTAAWLMRGETVRSRISVEYEMSDQPFANKYAMCELPQRYEATLPDNSFYYYFQRERISDATNQPSNSLKLNANISVFSSSKFSLNFQGSLVDDENDDLNSYTWERDMLISGINMFFTPSNKAALSLGYNYLNIESNAIFCVPVMDG